LIGIDLINIIRNTMAKNYSKKLKNGQTETHISITPIQYNKSKMNPVPFIVKRVISNTAAGAEALRPGWRTVRRSLIIAIVVGGTIIAVNQGDVLLAGAATPRVFVKMLITPCVPFCVSFYGAYVMYRRIAATLRE